MSSSDRVLSGELRRPRQMLAHQEYDNHASLHDDKMAEDLGFSGAPIEGPTHFSQFVPLLHQLFGDDWFSRGCISAHYQNMVIEGDLVQAFVQQTSANSAKIWAQKADGTPVLTGSASVGPDYGETELDRRRAKLRESEQLVLLADVEVGQQGASNPDLVTMNFDQHMGALYPFTLNEKLDVITEMHPYYTAEGAKSTSWKKAVIPLEMISVLTQYSHHLSGFRTRGPSVGLFASQEIKLIDGPLLVGEKYELSREIIALSESRRTESMWVLTRVFNAGSRHLVAEVILNSATLKDSYANYAADAKALGKHLD